MLLLCWCHASSQTNANKDSVKATNQSTDSTLKSGTNKLVLLRHTKTIPMPALQDADHDGIPDQLDLEPNTPEGADVDSHGRALDTDGDGVPDYKDKEKLTLQKCFPVDSNGVGTCPEPGCCKEVRQKLRELKDGDMVEHQHRCNLSTLPSICFNKGVSSLTADAVKLLSQVAVELQNNPRCNVRVTGYYGGLPTIMTQQLSWERVYAVIKYLVEKQGLNETRFIFEYGEYGTNNIVELIPTIERSSYKLPSTNPKHY